MSNIIKETDINPLSQLYDELTKILSGLVVKFSAKADEYETLENRKYSDTYISAMNKTDKYAYYEYSVNEYNAVDIYDKELISMYQSGELSIPKNIQDKLLINRRAHVIETYDEPNEYYRMLNGLPPKSVVGGTIVSSIINNSLQVVLDDDYELTNDYTSKRISESSAYNIMGNNLFLPGNYIHISNATIQDEKTSYSRSFIIVPDDYPIDKTMKAVYLKDVKSIFYLLDNNSHIPSDDVIGKYLHINIVDAIDTTTYVKYSYLVVEDDVVNYDKKTMIKITEALFNNKNVKVGDYIRLSGFYYVTEELSELYGISNKVPIHCILEYYGERFINILESSGYISSLFEKHPDAKYLEFIGEKKVDILTARSAKNFDILYIPPCSREIIEWVFSISYNAARDYFVNTVYNYYYRNIYDYYDNFIGLAICQLAISQTIAKAMHTAIDRDFYDETMVRLLFEMYGVPYYPNLPYQTQRRLVKNLNHLIQNKATNSIIFDIASILGYHDINIYKYYLVKERKFDSDGNLIYKDTTSVEPVMGTDGIIRDSEVVVNDLESMYDVYFQKVDINETNFQVALTDESKRVSYSSITLEDPLWWDDKDNFDEVYGDHTKYTAESESETYHTHYNYRETKYLGLSISYKMSEVLYENISLLRIIMDKKDEIGDIFVTLPKITGAMNISLFESIVFLCALISKQYHLKGEILTRYSSVMDVIGYINENVDGYVPCDTLSFNFELLTNADTYKELIKNPSKYIKPEEMEEFNKYLSILTLNQGTVSDKITAINNMYTNIKNLGYFIGRKMSEAENVFEYRSWRDFYNALFIGRENASMFKLGESDNVAKTYLEYLSVMNPSLYTAINEADENVVYTYIDHTISRIEKIIFNLKSLYAVNDSNSSLLMYLIKLIKFFKSYTTDLIDITTEYVFDMRPDNLFKMAEYYKIHQVNLNSDSYKLMYSDVMKVIETIKENDFIKYNDLIINKESVIFNDIHSLNNINCKSCKNFNNCSSYCHNDKSTCNGVRMYNNTKFDCRFYGYDTKEFLNYINKYRDLLITIDCGVFVDIELSIKNHLKKAYYAYKLVDNYNPYTDETKIGMPFSIEKIVDLLFVSLDTINELLEYHNMGFSISNSGVEGIVEWMYLLTSKDSGINRICKNVNYPCIDKICNLKNTKEDLKFEEFLLHKDYKLFTISCDFYATLWLNEYKSYFNDKINKIIETRNMNDSEYYLHDNIIIKDVISINDSSIKLNDIIIGNNKIDELKESVSLREELIMYEET